MHSIKQRKLSTLISFSSCLFRFRPCLSLSLSHYVCLGHSRSPASPDYLVAPVLLLLLPFVGNWFFPSRLRDFLCPTRSVLCSYVVGLETSQPAAIAAYIYGLVAKQEAETRYVDKRAMKTVVYLLFSLSVCVPVYVHAF